MPKLKKHNIETLQQRTRVEYRFASGATFSPELAPSQDQVERDMTHGNIAYVHDVNKITYINMALVESVTFEGGVVANRAYKRQKGELRQ